MKDNGTRAELLIKGVNEMINIPKGRAFISYSYRDENELKQLKQELLKQSVKPSPFPPINVSPAEMVSNDLIKSIIKCKSLIYIDTPNSKNSRWVTLEREYARHIGKPIYAYDPTRKLLTKDLRKPMVYPVFPSYTRQDDKKVRWIINFMRENRFFDIFIDYQDIEKGALFAEVLGNAIFDRMDRGGYLVVFWSHNSLNSLWVKREIDKIISSYPNQVLVTLLEDVPPPEALIDRLPIPMFGKGPHGLDNRRVDDLIVELYWLIQRK